MLDIWPRLIDGSAWQSMAHQVLARASPREQHRVSGNTSPPPPPGNTSCTDSIASRKTSRVRQHIIPPPAAHQLCCLTRDGCVAMARQATHQTRSAGSSRARHPHTSPVSKGIVHQTRPVCVRTRHRSRCFSSSVSFITCEPDAGPDAGPDARAKGGLRPSRLC